MRNAQFMYRPASAAAGFFIAAVFGALLDPILSGALGALGMAYYSLAMPAYALITVAGTAVFPAVIALMIAPRAKAGENEEVRSLFADSLLALVLPGAALGMLTALLASPVASLSNLYGGASALVGIAPLFLLSAAAAAFRGYFLGTGGYGIFALSVLVQQIGKVLLCPLLAGLGRGDPARMAEWACFGICIAEGLSLLMLAVLFAANRRSQKKQAEGERERVPLIGLARKLWRTGGLTTVCTALFTFFAMIDAFVIPGRFDAALFTTSEAAKGYALLASFAMPLAIFPGILCAFIALLGLRGTAKSRLEHNREEFSKRTALSIKGAFVLAIPAAMTVGVLARPLLAMLFSSAMTASQLGSAAELAEWLAPALVFAAVGIAAAVQLCAAGRASSATLNAAVALAVKLVLTLLLATSERNVFGGAFATAAAMFFFCAFSLVQLFRRYRLGFDALSSVAKPAVCAVCMGAAMYFLHFALLDKLIGSAGSIIAALAGYLIYIAMGLALRVFSADDFSRLPFGPKLFDFLNRTGMIK